MLPLLSFLLPLLPFVRSRADLFRFVSGNSNRSTRPPTRASSTTFPFEGRDTGRLSSSRSLSETRSSSSREPVLLLILELRSYVLHSAFVSFYSLADSLPSCSFQIAVRPRPSFLSQPRSPPNERAFKLTSRLLFFFNRTDAH